MINEIAQWMENNIFCSGDGIAWVLGETLFVGSLPQRTISGAGVPVRCAVVLETTPAGVNWYLKDQADKAVQIWNRAIDYWTARRDAYCFYWAMHGTEGWILPIVDGPEYEADSVYALGQPAPIANPGPEKLYAFSTNYIWLMSLRDP